MPVLKQLRNRDEALLAKEFKERADRWELESAVQSSPSAQFLHNDYQRIIGMGPAVIPLILERLKTSHRDWLWALERLVSEDENPAKGIEDFDEAVEAWLKWGAIQYGSER